MTKKLLSLLLAICLVVGLLPTMASAETTKTLKLNTATTDDPSLWEEFVEAFSSAGKWDNVAIEVTGNVELPAPLVNGNGATFYIRGIGNDVSISPKAGPSGGDATENKFKGKYLFSFSDNTNGYAPHLDIKNLTLNGGEMAGLVRVLNYGTVHFGSDKNETAPVRFINASTTEEQGSAIKLSNIPYASIQDCTFDNNVGSMSSSSTGCLYYSAPRSDPAYELPYTGLNIHRCSFTNNRSHSGGAMYVYGRKSYVRIDNQTVFENNYAGQRGGAIHCHGTVFADGATGDSRGGAGIG